LIVDGFTKGFQFSIGDKKLNKCRQRSGDANDDTHHSRSAIGSWDFWRITFENMLLRQDTVMVQHITSRPPLYRTLMYVVGLLQGGLKVNH